MRIISAFFVVLVLHVPALAQGEAARPDTPAQAAEKVLAAFRANEEAALRAIAGEDRPDPWLVAGELCSQGEYPAADAFASASPRKAVERLPAYVASCRERGADLKAMQALEAAKEAYRAKSWKRTVELTEVPDGPRVSLVHIRLLYVRGSALCRLGKGKQGAHTMLLAAKAAHALGWLRGAASYFGRSSNAARAAGDLEAATLALRFRLSLAQELEDRRLIGRTLSDLAYLEFQARRPTRAKDCLKRALALFEADENWPDVALTLMRLGDIHRRRGDYRKALNTFKQSLRIKRELGDRLGIAYTLNGMGNLEKNRGDYPAALRLFEESLTIKRELGRAASAAITIRNIGQVQILLCNYTEALRCFEEALKIDRDLGGKSGIARNLCQMGIVQKCLGNFGAAIAHHIEALKLQRAIGDRAGVAVTLGNLGVARMHQGNYSTALASYQESLEIHRKSGYRRGAATALGNIGLVQKLLGNYTAALELYQESLDAYERALELAEEMLHRDTCGKIRWGLARLLLKQNRPAEAAQSARLGVELVTDLSAGLAEGEGAGAREAYAGLFDAGYLAGVPRLRPFYPPPSRPRSDLCPFRYDVWDSVGGAREARS